MKYKCGEKKRDTCEKKKSDRLYAIILEKLVLKFKQYDNKSLFNCSSQIFKSLVHVFFLWARS